MKCLKRDKFAFYIREMRFWAANLTLLFFFGCMGHSPPPPFQQLTAAVQCGDPPRSVAVLPFVNNTDVEELEKEFRTSIFGHMAVHPYKDLELSLIDSLLEENSFTKQFAFTKSSIRQLGRILRCDAVIVGQVDDFYRVFLGVYSQMTMKGTVAIWDTRSGNKIWSDKQSISKREGGVPLSLLDLPLISVRSGFNLRKTIREQLVDDLSEFLVSRIPAPACFMYAENTDVRYAYELQVGAFLQKEHALKLERSFEEKGYSAYIRSNWDEMELWHRVFLGTYEDREAALKMQREIGEQIGTQPIVARFILEDPPSEKKLE